jgi:hypothetical protein
MLSGSETMLAAYAQEQVPEEDERSEGSWDIGATRCNLWRSPITPRRIR